MISCITCGIRITVETQYLPAHSNPRVDKYIFGYRITIENGNPEPVQLLRRHWHIFDSDGSRREVEGEGVVGLQPVIEPGDSHSYNSFCNLETAFGKMNGTYLMTRLDDNSFFDALIPEFQLIAPFKLN